MGILFSDHPASLKLFYSLKNTTKQLCKKFQTEQGKLMKITKREK